MIYKKPDFQTRKVELAVSESKKQTLTGNNLVITIKETLPLMSISDTLISRREVKTSTYSPLVLSRKDANNTIVDTNYYKKNKDYRFIFLTSFTSSVTNNYMRAYYDKVYMDIILIPELEYIDQNLKGNSYDVWGYRVGGGSIMNEEASDAVLPLETIFKLPTVKEDISNKHQVVTMHGLASNGSNNVWKTIVDSPEVGVLDKKNQLAGLLNLGTPKDVFTTPSPIPTYTITQSDRETYRVKYLGIKTPTNICIPIMF